MKLRSIMSTVAAVMLWQAFPIDAKAQQLSEVTGFGTNPGALKAFEYIPQGLPAKSPLVVALHGCTQSASDYDDEPGWVKYADMGKFALLLPEQQTINNQLRCFNWFDPNDIQRDEGEALSIKQMIDKVVGDHNIDPQRIYITGLSAGGGMTAVMLATYPELFNGGAIIAGLPYECANGDKEAFSCLNPGKNKSPVQWGNLVRNASSHQGPWPHISIWQGTMDFTVRPMNATELIDQWTNVHDTDQTPDGQDTVDGKKHQVFKDSSGNVVVESYTIDGMRHGTPINPGSGESECGTAAPYILANGICSSYYIAKSWGLLPTAITSMNRDQLLQRQEALQKQIDQLTEELKEVRAALEQNADRGSPGLPRASARNASVQITR